jgi:choline monooxygenase
MQSKQSPRDFADPNLYSKTRLPVYEATTLIPDAYRSSEFFEFERKRLWSTSWVCVGYECQLKQPGDLLRGSVAGQQVLVVRNKQDQLRAFYNVCRHRAAELVTTDSAHCSVIRCPYHGWGYSLDGRLLGAPFFQGLDIPASAAEIFRVRAEEQGKFCKEDYGLLPVQVDTWGGLVFCNLSSVSMPLRQWLGDLPERYCRHPLHELELVRRKQYEIKANWKLVAENFMEYYHLPTVHPELCNISGVADHYRYQGPGMYTGMCTSPISDSPNTVRLDLPNYPGLDETESVTVYFPLIFPNIALWMFPNHLVTLLYQPIDATTTIEYMDILIHPSARDLLDTDASQLDEKLNRITDFWDMVNWQDIRIVESVQRGLLNQSYPGGRMCYEFEEPVHRFQNMVIDRLLGIDQVPPGDVQPEVLGSNRVRQYQA